MKKKYLTALLCAAAVIISGCAGAKTESAAAGEAKTAAAQEETAEEADGAEAGSGDIAEGNTGEYAPFADTSAAPEGGPAASGEKYESEDGWSVYYDSDLVSVEERADAVVFAYTGESSGTNEVRISYIPNTSTDIVLADALIDYERSRIERSEGYFAGRRDIWAFSADVVPQGSYRQGYTAVEYNGGVLLVERIGYEESDEELGEEITRTMSAIPDSVEFEDMKPQAEYDYVPGKYKLDTEEVGENAANYPSLIILRDDHTGTITIQDTVDIVWYSRDGLIRENYAGGESYYYSIEGDMLYLQQGEEYVPFVKDTSAAAAAEIRAGSGTASASDRTQKSPSFATYESKDGWLVYYDKDLLYVNENGRSVSFVYGEDAGGTDMLEFTYHPYDTTDEVLGDLSGNYDPGQIGRSEGFIGGRHDAWGFTITLPSEGESGLKETCTAVEHNGGTLLIEKILHESADEEEMAKIGETLDEILNTFMFTEHDPQREYDYIPGTYLLNDKRLQKDASNYPSSIRLYEDHSGVLRGSKDVSIVWYAREPVIKETAAGGTSYNYHIEGDTLYLEMDEEQVEFDRKEKTED